MSQEKYWKTHSNWKQSSWHKLYGLQGFFKSDFLKNRTYFFLKLICYITSNPQLMLIFWYSHHTFHNPMRLAADYLILWAKSM